MANCCVIQASLGGIDQPSPHVPQTVPFDHFLFIDDNFPPRKLAMTPRLQAKIPKCFGWQLKPGYDFYLWLDGNISLADPHALQFFLDEIEGYDIVVLRHPRRPNIRQEVRYTRKGINQQSIYMLSRYEGEWLKEFYDLIQQDKTYVDDLLVNGGVIFYRNTKEVQAMMKDWWYYQTRYILQDQISFPYVLRNLKVKVLDKIYDQWDLIKYKKHRHR